MLSKKSISALLCILLVLFLGMNAGVSGKMTDAKETVKETRSENEVTLENGEKNNNSFTKEGTTLMGTISQMAEFSLNRVLMYVEEVYVTAGDTIAEGDALFKISEDCITEAKEYYESAILIAEDTLTEAKLAFESGELEASYLKSETENRAANAEAELETALAEVDEEITEKYEEWQSAVYQISAYNEALSNNVYYTRAEVPEKEAALASAQTTYENAIVAYQATGTTYEAEKSSFDSAVAELEAVVSGTSISGLTIEDAARLVVEGHQRLATVEPLYQETERTNRELEQAKQAFTQAQSNYEKSQSEAQKALEQLEGSVDSLEQKYESATLEAETKKLSLQKEYETAVLEGEYAQTVYNNTIETLKSAQENAQKTLNELKEEQTALLALENGVVCANQSGILASISYDAEDVLFSGTELVSYYDTSTLSISVEVEQENIAKIAVGDEVNVSLSESRRGNVTGKVASIAATATTGRSVSDVTYTVIISIENQNNMLSAGTSATVTFIYGE